MVNIDQIKQLRKETGLAISECKKVLTESGGNIEKAKEILRKWGCNFARKIGERATTQGIIESYIHPNRKIGALLDIRCESDFVAKSEDFRNLAHELCLQIAAMNPLFLKVEDIPEKFLDGERKIYRKQFSESGKPQKIINEIVEEKLKKYKEEISLLSQPWIKDESKTIKDLISEHIAKLGENIVVKSFARYEI
ncbi:MAG: elongation factor Ts [Candidatus Nealsonbacteria bacterium CG_4_9_14_0_2_um_filter_37_38]|uniref:Elongation factor Ts n=1 Tax=Candidatus Nealsonbacteria bacterium CG_4_10_14_0_8_um_filter_37_14 TaxID=1974684 RepID=A0A2M7R6H3_9BACT|nr:MAG: elongation factor Ts [Candidatus Nealsonbacteria bacterium CG11_big_fil_rev_8_21_14_0_20_37_68]PIY88436.1 MAG: elongation factor Ts [Candidatus Nealsonbacteria bacterium CG_4_10_14_0_8_um_filter_37_14]PJC51914.1 MAG: elongation factor Ts [Candidatus Nealsonbacteria bacterium CG_4_9_14_0_2_um_filter_37_38]